MTLAFSDLLATLGYAEGDHLSICAPSSDGTFTAQIVTAQHGAVYQIPQDRDVWFGVNPVSTPIGSSKRGAAQDVTRLAALYADLDVKTGSLASIDDANAVIDQISEALHVRPTVIVQSGGGLHPYWPIDGLITGDPAATLLRRFGRLVKDRVHKIGGGKADSVYDLSRVLRVPGSINHKYGAEVLAIADTGYPITPTAAHEALLEQGIPDLPEDHTGERIIVSPRSEWEWGERTSPYVTSMIAGWAGDTPTGRHQWMVSQAVRLACAHRLGKITQQDYVDAVIALEAHFRHLLTTGQVRALGPWEIGGAHEYGQAMAASKTEAEAGREIGVGKSDPLFEGAQIIPFDPGGQQGTVGDGENEYKFKALDWHALWADDKEQEWMHYPLIPAGRGIALVSAPKLGKSLVLLELAQALSRGVSCLGYEPTKRRHVLYVDHENDPRGDIRERLEDMDVTPDQLDYLHYLSFPSMDALDTRTGGQQLMDAVRHYQAELVVIDTVSRTIEGEENSNDTWLKFYRYTGELLKAAGVAMIRIDHTGKDDTKGARGGSAKSGDVDMTWTLRAGTGKDKLVLECLSSRVKIDDTKLTLTRKSDPLRHDVDTTSGIADFEARVNHVIEICDQGGLHNDSSTRETKAFLKGKIQAQNSVKEEAIRRRKKRGHRGVPEGPRSVPRDARDTPPKKVSPGDSYPQGDTVFDLPVDNSVFTPENDPKTVSPESPRDTPGHRGTRGVPPFPQPLGRNGGGHPQPGRDIGDKEHEHEERDPLPKSNSEEHGGRDADPLAKSTRSDCNRCGTRTLDAILDSMGGLCGECWGRDR